MKVRWALAVLLCVTVSGSEQPPEQLFGRWKVTALATASPVTAMSGGAAAGLVGHVLRMTSDKLQFAGETCNPTYEQSKETLIEIAQDYKIDPGKLDLPDPVLRYDADCTEVFVAEPGRIVFPWKGYFFKATRKLSPGTPTY